MQEPVVVTLGGRERTLKYRPSTMRDFERTTGETVMQAVPKKGFETLAALLWCGLKHEDDRLTINKVFSYLDKFCEEGHDISDLWEDVSNAMLDAGLFGRDARRERQSEGKAPAPATS